MSASANGEEQQSVTEEFRETARRHPQRIALSDGERSLTYSELDLESNCLAAAIAGSGAGQGALVGILVDRTVATPTTILGVLKSGAAYVPLDPTYPRERLKYIVQDAGLELLIGARGDALACGLEGLPVIDPNDLDEQGADWVSAASVGSDAPAYVIYTSGSTGLPKGCVVSHGNVLALLHSALPLFEFTPADRWAVFHSHSFDFSVWELWGPLLTGGTAVCVPSDIARSPEDFLGFLDEQGITILNQVPSIFRALVRIRQKKRNSAESLRYVIFGGETIDLPSVREFLVQNDHVQPVMVNMYGITEITVHATIKVLGPQDFAGSCPSPIGRELPHLRIDLRDGDGRPVIDGEPGEMWVTGASVALSYLNRPELTHELFRKGPVGRSYRTGDLARRLASGELEYLGRKDEQVKLRGFRIELPEIDFVLRTHELVKDAAATVANRASSGQALVAYIVPEVDADSEDLLRAVRVHAASKLPDYMRPARYLFVDSLPLTSSGKLDRKRLSLCGSGDVVTPGLALAEDGVGSLAETVASVWADVLGTDDFDDDESFFDVGGDSLSIVVVHNRLVDALPGSEIRIVDLFAHTTVREIAGFLEREAAR
ncbi:non-ribosomal peptide synthetase [Streptomyces rochei]|uniref:non-ribosomal peptide synthetase n=1 Tax=Streptomyces rochei TaxID=1928 RepID=UPI0036BF25E1